MAGVDKIIGEILEEAEKAANENRQEAQKKADAILEDAKKECAKAEKETDQKIEVAKKSIEQRAKSSAQLKKRQEILKARQQIISEILDKSYQHIFQMGEQEYFALMEKMLRKFALPKDGEIHFSKTDLERMPSGFGKVIEDAAAQNGGTLVLSQEAMQIDGGFILVYGGVEENCSLQTIFHTQREYLADKVHEFLIQEN